MYPINIELTKPDCAPVLLLIFNRPNETERVFHTIRAAQPKKLFISGDGPRSHNSEDRKNCALAREIVLKIDWKCEVFTKFESSNLGCKRAVVSGIDWFFQHVTHGIILEDDTLPDASFFPFCSELLDKYRDDTRIMKISGSNFIGATGDGRSDYIPTTTSLSWGWASWARAWKLNDPKMHLWPVIKARGAHKRWPFYPERNRCFDSAYHGLDTWDYQWDFSICVNSGLHLIPKYNLVKNIGFNENATHTKTDFERRSLMPIGKLSTPLTHPINPFFADREYDKLFERRLIIDKFKLTTLYMRLKHRFQKIYSNT